MSAQPPSTDGTFARITLEGARFDGAKIPLEALEELIRYQNLIISAAKARWAEEHPDEEIPEELGKAAELNLADVREGSAISVLERPAESANGEFDALVSEAHSDVDELISEATSGALYSVDFPDWANVDDFWDLGKSLLAGEQMHIARPSTRATKTATVSMTVRNDVIEPLKKDVKGRRSDSFDLIEGRVAGLYITNKSFQFATLDSGEVKGWCKSLDITAELHKVLGDSVLGVPSAGQIVLLLGRVGLKKGQLARVHDATFLARPHDAFIPGARKLASLNNLDDGWMGEGSLRPQPKTLARAGAVLTVVRQAGLMPPPGVFPTEDGGVLFEWASGAYVFSIEVEADSSIVAYNLYPEQTRGESNEVGSPALLTPIIKDWVPVING